MQVTTNPFIQRWAGQNRAVVEFVVTGIPQGQTFETAMTDMAGTVHPDVPWKAWSETDRPGRWCPTGGPWVAAIRYNGSVAYSTAAQPGGFHVGDTTLFGLSQSNQSNMCTVGSSVPAGAQTSMFAGSNWGQVTGDGARAYANKLVTLSGVPQCVIFSAVRSTAVTKLGYDAHHRIVGEQLGCWEDDTKGIYSAMVAALSTNENRIARVIMTAGESDALNVPGAVFSGVLDKRQSDVNALVNDRDPEWYLTTMRSDYGTYVPGADATPIIAAQQAFAASGKAVLGPSLDSYPTDSTGVHLASYVQLGEDLADLVYMTEYI